MRAYIITIPSRARVAARVYQGLAQVPGIDAVSILVDHEHNGPWWNTARALAEIATGGQPALIAQDDVKVRGRALAAHLEALVGHLGYYGLISLFAPPQGKYSDMLAQGYHGEESYSFLWAQMYLVSPDFAHKAMIADSQMDQSKVTRHDEVRYRYAAQLFEVPMVTMAASFCSHDLEVKSTMGTPAKIGKVVRDTHNFIDPADDLTTLRLKKGYAGKADLREYAA